MFDVLDRQTKLTGNQNLKSCRCSRRLRSSVGSYAAEVWPSHLRTTGMGSAHGFGGIGRIIGPLGLALIVGSNNYLKLDVPLPQIPMAFLYLGCWFLIAGVVYYFFGLETKGKSIAQIDKELATA